MKPDIERIDNGLRRYSDWDIACRALAADPSDWATFFESTSAALMIIRSSHTLNGCTYWQFQRGHQSIPERIGLDFAKLGRPCYDRNSADQSIFVMCNYDEYYPLSIEVFFI